MNENSQRACLSYGPFTTCVLPIRISRPNLKTRCHRDNRAQNTGINQTSSQSGVQLLTVQPKKFHTSKKQVILRINVSKISLLSLTQNFGEALEREIRAVQIGNSTSEKCEIPQDIIHCTTLAIFGKITSKSKTSSAMTPVIEDKRTALAEYKRPPNQRNLQTLRAAISKAQKTATHGYRLLTRTQ